MIHIPLMRPQISSPAGSFKLHIIPNTSGSSGLYYYTSTDGVNWTQISQLPASQTTWNTVTASGQYALVATTGNVRSHFIWSNNYGETWNADSLNRQYHQGSMAWAPLDFMANEHNAYIRATTNGSTFSTVFNNSYITYNFAVSRNDLQYWYAGNYSQLPGKIWRSTNYGGSWAQIQVGPTTAQYIRGAACSADGQIVYVSSMLNSAGFDLYKSTSYGDSGSWTGQRVFSDSTSTGMYVRCSLSGQHVFYGNLTNVWVSHDYADTWTQITGLNVLGRGNEFMSSSGKYIAVRDYSTTGRFLFSSDYGDSWTQLSTPFEGIHPVHPCVSEEI